MQDAFVKIVCIFPATNKEVTYGAMCSDMLHATAMIG